MAVYLSGPDRELTLTQSRGLIEWLKVKLANRRLSSKVSGEGVEDVKVHSENLSNPVAMAPSCPNLGGFSSATINEPSPKSPSNRINSLQGVEELESPINAHPLESTSYKQSGTLVTEEELLSSNTTRGKLYRLMKDDPIKPSKWSFVKQWLKDRFSIRREKREWNLK